MVGFNNMGCIRSHMWLCNLKFDNWYTTNLATCSPTMVFPILLLFTAPLCVQRLPSNITLILSYPQTSCMGLLITIQLQPKILQSNNTYLHTPTWRPTRTVHKRPCVDKAGLGQSSPPSLIAGSVSSTILKSDFFGTPLKRTSTLYFLAVVIFTGAFFNEEMLKDRITCTTSRL